jgi:hypothetical protein
VPAVALTVFKAALKATGFRDLLTVVSIVADWYRFFRHNPFPGRGGMFLDVSRWMAIEHT